MWYLRKFYPNLVQSSPKDSATRGRTETLPICSIGKSPSRCNITGVSLFLQQLFSVFSRSNGCVYGKKSNPAKCEIYRCIDMIPQQDYQACFLSHSRREHFSSSVKSLNFSCIISWGLHYPDDFPHVNSMFGSTQLPYQLHRKNLPKWSKFPAFLFCNLSSLIFNLPYQTMVFISYFSHRNPSS